jgi:ribosomal protein S12 methylthiotransferase
VRQGLQLHRPAVAARVERGAQADEAPRHAPGCDTLLTRIRERVPGVSFRTTFIVGFPGETEADVDQLCGFIGDHAFDHVGVFTYSHETAPPPTSSTTTCRRERKRRGGRA